MATENRTNASSDQAMSLSVAAEKYLVRQRGSTRHIHYRLAVAKTKKPQEREPISLALVLDRSGSMSGPKLHTAKKAALAVMDRLSEADTASLTVFDTHVQTILPAVPMTRENKERAHRELGRIEAAATTALYEGWLTGCESIASRSPIDSRSDLRRCFLLTDGLANVGETDPELIAAEAAGIRSNAGIGTSTFGIGTDYNEGLLGPMAVAGGGQFHHLRHENEITATFAGELGEIMNVAAKRVQLEIGAEGTAKLDVVSEYRPTAGEQGHMLLEVGDLMSGEERHVVIRARTAPHAPDTRITLRARLRWIEGDTACQTDWMEATFVVADGKQCDAESRDRQVLRWVGLHHAARTKRLALDAMRHRKEDRAMHLLETAIRRLGRYAQGDHDLEHALVELRELLSTIKARSLTAEARRETEYRSLMSSRGQRDHRG